MLPPHKIAKEPIPLQGRYPDGHCRPLRAESKGSVRSSKLNSRDHMDVAARSALISRVRREGTAPELTVRSVIHQMRLRFRVDCIDLPGRPDIILPRWRAAIFVHGCFWHRHKNCRRASVPATRTAYWMAKFARNVKRDTAARRHLKARGWKVLTLWECEIKNKDALRSRIHAFLHPRKVGQYCRNTGSKRGIIAKPDA